MIFDILIAILLFGVLIFVHELGHFLAAKRSGVRVNEFAMGMGPVIFSRTRGETRYSLRAFPIGGFCKMEGEDENSEDDRALNRKPVYKRLFIMTAGSLMNILLGVIISVCIIIGTKNLISTTVAVITEDGPSAAAGLQVGDRIVRINRQPVWVDLDLIIEMPRVGSAPVDLTVVRDGKRVTLTIPFEMEEYEGMKMPMLDFKVKALEKTPGNVLKYSVFRPLAVMKSTYTSLLDMITGRISVKNVSGPVGTTVAISEAASRSFGALMEMFTFITLSIGIFNLLPLPALDGGRVIFLIIEAIRGKPVKPEYEGYIHFAGLVLLLLFMVFVSVNDIQNLVKRA